MKALGVLLGLLLVGVMAWLLMPRLLRRADSPPNAPAARMPGQITEARQTEKVVETPLSDDEKMREDLIQKRLPYYQELRQQFADVLVPLPNERTAPKDALDTLELIVTQEEDAALLRLMQDAITPQARRYGFRRVQFYVRNPSSDPQPRHLIAEASEDGAGHWNLFRK